MKVSLIVLSVLATVALIIVFNLWWWLLPFGLIILVALGYIERILNCKWSPTWHIALLTEFLILSAWQLIFSKIRENSLNYELDTKSAQFNTAEKQIKELESSVIAVQKYSDVAYLSCMGTPSSGGKGIRISSVISKKLEGTYKQYNGRYFPLCGSESEAKYREVIEKHPRFPFSYYWLALCLREKGDEAWKDYARKAVQILENTTKISGHHENHDQALKRLKEHLNE